MTSYWLSNFCTLFSSVNVIPFVGEDKNYQYNSLTRLIILVTILGYIYTDDISIIFSGLISLTLSVVFYFSTFNTKSVENSTDTYKLEKKTDADKIVKKDEVQNQTNQITLNYSPPDTDDMRKHLYFLDGDTSKSKIEDLNIDPSDFTYSGPKVMHGVTKSLNKLNSDI